MRKCISLVLVSILCKCLFAQSPEVALSTIKQKLEENTAERKDLQNKYNQATYGVINHKLKKHGLPSNNYIEHKAFIFEYSEQHEQAKWVSHIITPDIANLGFARSNDFRIDPLVTSGTTDSIDYFLYDGSKPKKRRYEGYGYDRGHLAASADFRWSEEALSESYFYSNISPQHPEFNRGVWADLESLLREYVIDNNVSLTIVSAPILIETLPKIKQSPNGVSIPHQFIKIAYDATNERSIAFLMPNKKLPNPPSYYAMSVNDLEEITGYNYFPNIDEVVESTYSENDWFKESLDGNTTPIKQNTLPIKHFNTTTAVSQAKSNKTIHVCGTVVGTRYSRKGHAWLNLDKKYPNQVFSIFIRKDELTNFPFDPVVEYKDDKLCFEGKVEKWGDTIVMQVEKTERVSIVENLSSNKQK